MFSFFSPHVLISESIEDVYRLQTTSCDSQGSSEGFQRSGHEVLGLPNKLPHVFLEIDVKYYLLRRLLGVKTEGDSRGGKVQKLKKGEILMVNIGSTASGGRISGIKVRFSGLADAMARNKLQ